MSISSLSQFCSPVVAHCPGIFVGLFFCLENGSLFFVHDRRAVVFLIKYDRERYFNTGYEIRIPFPHHGALWIASEN